MIYIIFLILTFLVLSIVFYQLQYFMIFTPTKQNNYKICDRCEYLSIFVDGIELEGVVYEPVNVKETILFFAGRSHDSVALINRFSLLYPEYRIVTFNYRSYGRSEGEVNEKNILNDGVEIAKLVKKYYGSFYIIGFSLGSSVASYVSLKMGNGIKGLFIIGGFDSIYELVRSKYGISIRKFLRYKFNTLEFLKRTNIPTYIFASLNDEMIPITNTINLRNNIKNLKGYIEFENLNHKELLWDDRIIKYIKERMIDR